MAKSEEKERLLMVTAAVILPARRIQRKTNYKTRHSIHKWLRIHKNIALMYMWQFYKKNSFKWYIIHDIPGHSFQCT